MQSKIMQTWNGEKANGWNLYVLKKIRGRIRIVKEATTLVKRLGTLDEIRHKDALCKINSYSTS